MKRIAGYLAAALLVSLSAYAHGGFQHIQGTVRLITPNALTIEVVDKATKATSSKTITLADHTMFERSGQKATLKDLKVGDRVVIDVEEGKLEGHLVKFGPPAPKAVAPASHDQHAGH